MNLIWNSLVELITLMGVLSRYVDKRTFDIFRMLAHPAKSVCQTPLVRTTRWLVVHLLGAPAEQAKVHVSIVIHSTAKFQQAK